MRTFVWTREQTRTWRRYSGPWRRRQVLFGKATDIHFHMSNLIFINHLLNFISFLSRIRFISFLFRFLFMSIVLQIIEFFNPLLLNIIEFQPNYLSLLHTMILFGSEYDDLILLVLRIGLKQRWWRLQIVMKSLFYNEFLNWSYACDILMEPMFWFVENFTSFLGPVRFLNIIHPHSVSQNFNIIFVA